MYVFSDDDNYATGYLSATTAIGTTTAIDNATALSGNAPPVSGANTAWPSVKYLITDGAHLVGAGAWETSAGTGFSPSTRLVVWTPALGSTTTDGDDERMSDTTTQKSYLYVDAGVTGLGGPLYGSLFVFGYRSVWKMVPTGQASAAYTRLTLRSDIGCIRHQTICMGEDAQGRPALYWLSHIGPYRMSADGLQYIGRDVEDQWFGTNGLSAVNLSATSVVGWSIFVSNLHQDWFYVSTGSNNDPNIKLVFDCRLGRVVDIRNITTVRYGWARHTGVSTEARCGVLFANTLGTSMSRDLLPYIGRTGTGITAPTLWKAGGSTTQDGSTNYQGLLTTKAYSLQPGSNLSMRDDAYLIAPTSASVTITLTTNRDFSAETATSTVVLTAVGSESRNLLKFEGAAVGQAGYVQFQVGDAAAANTTWTLDGLVTPLTKDDPR